MKSCAFQVRGSEEAWRVLKSSLGIFGRFRKVDISERLLPLAEYQERKRKG